MYLSFRRTQYTLPSSSGPLGRHQRESHNFPTFAKLCYIRQKYSIKKDANLLGPQSIDAISLPSHKWAYELCCHYGLQEIKKAYDSRVGFNGIIFIPIFVKPIQFF